METAPKLAKVKFDTQFIRPSRGGSTSFWGGLLGRLGPEGSEGPEGQKEGQITEEEFIAAFVSQIQADRAAMDAGGYVSDAAIVAWRPRHTSDASTLSREKRLANAIAQAIFPMGGKTAAEHSLFASMHYQRLLGQLTAYHTKQEREAWEQRRQEYMNKILSHKSFCSLRNKPLSIQVREPKAMYVEVAKEEDLLPFMNHLQSNNPVQPNMPEETIFTGDEVNCMRFDRGAVYTDGRMDLCKQVVGPDHIERLMDALRNNTHIRHFLLGNNVIGLRGAKAIAAFLSGPHLPQIETWYLAGNCIDAEGIGFLAAALQTDPHMRHLWLKRNPLTPAGMGHIGELLRRNQNIKTLDLHNTAVLDEGMEALCAGLAENDSLRYLYLDANGISETGIEHLARYFATRDPAKKGAANLWVDMNRLGDEGAIKLFKSLRNYKWIKRLVIGSNGLTAAAARVAYECLADKPNLRVLDLGVYKATADMGEATNRIGDEGLEWIGRLVQDNTALRMVNVLHNGVTLAGLERFNTILQKQEHVCYFFSAESELSVPTELKTQIQQRLRANFEQVFGAASGSRADYKLQQRILKSSRKIQLIDSIYRNRM
jgi:Ran GTPase-activating protein (RanGAP) involved in mRNA processing and transport